MKRIYETALTENLKTDRQMLFLSGPRQVGKTTTCKALSPDGPYLNWDNQNDRALLVRGPRVVWEGLRLHELRETLPIVVFDELHKYAKWKQFLKGLFDTYGDTARFVVTGSARLDIYKRGGDSLMGRYFPCRMHPISLSEAIRTNWAGGGEIYPPSKPPNDLLEQLTKFGGFPEPFLRADSRFFNRWKTLRREQFVREELRDLTRVAEIGQLSVLVELLARRAGALVNYSSFARDINVSVDTIRRWMTILQMLYLTFEVRPWHRNVAKSLRKQPKVYLWDWSAVFGEGPRFENLIASHLLKAVNWWTDQGFGNYGLHFLRDTAGREVDFLVTKDDQPWFLAEAKVGGKDLHAPLTHFSKSTGAAHAFHVVRDLDYIDRDCFSVRGPAVVPATTLLSQLI